MSNPILLVRNAGYGETPVPKNALMQPGATMVINDENDGSKSDAVILAVVPRGGCIEYAIADQNKQPLRSWQQSAVCGRDYRKARYDAGIQSTPRAQS